MNAEYLTKTEQLPPDNVSPPFRTVECLESMKKECSQDEIIETYKTLLKIVDAIIASPQDASKRKLKFSNVALQKKVLNFPSAVRCLKSAFFVEKEIEGDGRCLVLEVAYTLRLAEVLSHISRFLNEYGVTATTSASVFNPYKSSFASTQTDQKLGITSGNIKFDPFAAKKAYEEREKILIAGGVGVDKIALDPEPEYGLAGVGRGVEEALRDLATSELESDNMNLIDVLGKEGIENLKRSLLNTSTKFQSRRLIELERLYKQKIFDKVILRFQFPCNSTVQMKFRPSSTLHNSREVLESLLSEQARSQVDFLFTAPPLTKLDEKLTLYSLSLQPCSLIHVAVKSAETWKTLAASKGVFADQDAQKYIDYLKLDAATADAKRRRDIEEERERMKDEIREKVREAFSKNEECPKE